MCLWKIDDIERMAGAYPTTSGIRVGESLVWVCDSMNMLYLPVEETRLYVSLEEPVNVYSGQGWMEKLV